MVVWWCGGAVVWWCGGAVVRWGSAWVCDETMSECRLPRPKAGQINRVVARRSDRYGRPHVEPASGFRTAIAGLNRHPVVPRYVAQQRPQRDHTLPGEKAGGALITFGICRVATSASVAAVVTVAVVLLILLCSPHGIVQAGLVEIVDLKREVGVGHELVDVHVLEAVVV